MNCALQSAGTIGAAWPLSGSDQGEPPPSCSVRTRSVPRCPLRNGSPGQGTNTDSSVVTRQVRSVPGGPAAGQCTSTACCSPDPAGRSQLSIGVGAPRQVASSRRSRRSWRGTSSTADGTVVLSPKEVLGLTLSQCSAAGQRLPGMRRWRDGTRMGRRGRRGVPGGEDGRDGCRWWNLPDRRRGGPQLRGQGQLGRGGPDRG